MMRIRYAVYFIFILLSLGSCVKDTVDLSKISNTVFWDPALGVPLSTGTVTMEKLLETMGSAEYLGTYPDGLIYLKYTHHLLAQEGAMAMKLPTQNFQMELSSSGLGLPSVLPATTYTFPTQSADFTFTTKDNAEIDSTVLKSGTLTITSGSSFPQPGTSKITFPTLLKDGVALQVDFTYSGKGASDTKTVSLEGYMLKLTRNGTTANQMRINFDVSLNNNPAQTLDGSEKITANLQISDADFKILYGYLGAIDLLNDESENRIEVFKTEKSSNIVFADPRINVIVRNSYGTPIQLKIENSRTYSHRTETYFDMRYASSINPFNISYPSLSQIGGLTRDTIKYTKATCNVDSAMAIVPQYFYYKLRATTNPAGRPTLPNFVTDTSKLNVDLEVELPLHLKAGNLVLFDTMALDLSNTVKDFSIVKKLAFYTSFNSYMPFDMRLQVIFADENYASLDSMYDTASQPVLKSGVLNLITNKISEPTKKQTSATFDADRAKKFNSVKYAIIRSELSTYGNGEYFVKFLKEYKLDVSFQLQTELQVRSLNQL